MSSSSEAPRHGQNPSLTREEIDTLVYLYYETHLTSKQVAKMMHTTFRIVQWYWKPLTTQGKQRRSIRNPPLRMPATIEEAKQQLAREVAIAKREMTDPRTPIYDPEDLEY